VRSTLARTFGIRRGDRRGSDRVSAARGDPMGFSLADSADSGLQSEVLGHTQAIAEYRSHVIRAIVEACQIYRTTMHDLPLLRLGNPMAPRRTEQLRHVMRTIDSAFVAAGREANEMSTTAAAERVGRMVRDIIEHVRNLASSTVIALYLNEDGIAALHGVVSRLDGIRSAGHAVGTHQH